MLLVIDVGNTNTVFALFEGEEVRGQWRLSTHAPRTADEYGIWLQQILERAGINPASINHAIAASVVPETTFALQSLCENYFHTNLLLVGSGDIKVDMPVLLDRPAELGADRLVNAYAAWQHYRQSLVVVDFGTATTFDVVNDKGQYLGGVIAPGVNLSLDALQKAAAKLPSVSIHRPASVIGKSTIHAMQSGIYYGYVGLIEGICAGICSEYGQNMIVLATGGLASLYAEHTTLFTHVDEDLTIRGLSLIFRQHTKG